MSEQKVMQQQVLSADVKAAIDQELKKYPADQAQSAVISALRFAQQANGGYLTDAIMDAVADYLSMPAIAVYEVATFYSMYDLEKVGRHKVCLCNSISCMLRGAEPLFQHIKERYQLDENHTSADGKFTLKEVECLGACIGAPAVQIDDKNYYENVDAEKIDQLIEALD